MARDAIWFIKLVCSFFGFLGIFFYTAWIFKGIAEVEAQKISRNSSSQQTPPS